jgi:colicin import membrane protein
MSSAALRNSAHIERGRVPAAVLAVVVHVIFFAFMIFGLNWKTEPPEGMMVDLWSTLPPPPAPVQPVIKAAPPSPKPVEQPPEVKPLPLKPETPPPPKPDIAIKEKIEKPKPEKKPDEKKQQLEKERKELQEKKEKEQKEKKEKEQREKEQREKEQQARVAAEVEQLRREQEASDRLQAQAAAQSRLTSEIAEYKAKILAKIRRNIVIPPDLPGNPVVEFDVTVLPVGDILDVKLRRSSGFAAFDSAVERGIFLSKPLPLPPDPALFPKFRNLSVKVHYHE